MQNDDNDVKVIADVVVDSGMFVMAPCSGCGKTDVPHVSLPAIRWIHRPNGRDDKRTAAERTEFLQRRLASNFCAGCIQAGNERIAEKKKQEHLEYLQRLRTPAAQREIGIPDQFLDCSFDDSPDVGRVVCELYAGDTKLRSVVLSGIMGCGKSRMVYAAVRQAHADGQPEAVERHVCSDLALQMRAYDYKGTDCDALIYHQKHFPGLLCWDDFRAEEFTPSMRMAMMAIIDHRAEQGSSRRMLITTNLTQDQLRAAMPHAPRQLTQAGRTRWIRMPSVDFRQVDRALL